MAVCGKVLLIWPGSGKASILDGVSHFRESLLLPVGTVFAVFVVALSGEFFGGQFAGQHRVSARRAPAPSPPPACLPTNLEPQSAIFLGNLSPKTHFPPAKTNARRPAMVDCSTATIPEPNARIIGPVFRCTVFPRIGNY